MVLDPNWLIFFLKLDQFRKNWVVVNRSNFSGRKDRGRTFWSNCRDRKECGRILSYLLYGSVASLPSPSSNIEAWPYGTSLRFAPAIRALGVCEHIWLRYKNFDPSCFDPIQKIWYVDLRTNSDFRSRSFDLLPPTRKNFKTWIFRSVYLDLSFAPSLRSISLDLIPRSYQ